MKRATILIFILAVACAACKEKEPPKPVEAPPPPPPSAEQLRSEALNTLTAILTPGVPATKEEVQQKVNEIVSKLNPEPNGATAKTMITSDVRELLKTAKTTAETTNQPNDWNAVLKMCDALEAFVPDDTRIESYRERAKLEKSKPQVFIKGFTTDTNTNKAMVIVEVYLPDEDRTERKQVMENEEFFGLKYIETIGKMKGIRLRYLPTGDEFDVLR